MMVLCPTASDRAMRQRWLARLLAAAVLTIAFACRAEVPGLAYGPVPSWVVALQLPEGNGDLAASNGLLYVLCDRQVRVSGRGQQTYQRVVRQITNESGLQAASQFFVDFDPSFETLTLHSVVVRRGDATFDRLDRDALRVVQREKNLDAQIYDGRLSAFLFVADLRVGDIVDYEYTVSASDPTLDGRYADSVVLGTPYAIERMHVRLLLPRGKNVSFVPFGPATPDDPFTPVQRTKGEEVEYVWDRSGVKAYPLEPDAPSSFDPLPWIEVTEFANWQEIAQLGARLFEVAPMAPSSPSKTGEGGSPLRDWVDKTRTNALSTEDFVLQATRFVQDEIRYVAVEVGMSRRRPSDPEVVFRHRYGDCKDKAALLVAMLRVGHVDARPALVPSTLGQGLDAWAPSPLAFDHVIVRVITGEGRILWIDPTATLQGGGVERLRFSSFERALVLDPTVTHLERLNHSPAAEPSLAIRDSFKVSPPGTEQDTILDSVHVYRGAIADDMRAVLQVRGKDQAQKHFLKLYEASYPGVRAAGTMDAYDDRVSNYVRIALHLAIPHFWSRTAPEAPFAAQIVAGVIDRALARPSTTDRTAPFALSYPMHATYEAEAYLPFLLRMEPEYEQVSPGAFRFNYSGRCDKYRLVYSFELTNLAAEVKPGSLKSYTDAIDRVRPFLFRSLTYQPRTRDGVNWPILGLLMVPVPLLVWGATRLYRYNPKLGTRKRADPHRAGFHGWLAILGVYIFLLPVGCAWPLLGAARYLAFRSPWAGLTTESGHASVGSLVFAEALISMALTAYACALVVIFVSRRRSFPLHFAAVILAREAMIIADVIISTSMTASHEYLRAIAQAAGGGIWTIVWVTYAWTSRRVAATFVE